MLRSLPSDDASGVIAEALEETFTERELQILRRMAAGHSNKAIAEQIFLSPATIKWYSRRLYEKLRVKSRTQAVARARALGLLD